MFRVYKIFTSLITCICIIVSTTISNNLLAMEDLSDPNASKPHLTIPIPDNNSNAEKEDSLSDKEDTKPKPNALKSAKSFEHFQESVENYLSCTSRLYSVISTPTFVLSLLTTWSASVFTALSLGIDIFSTSQIAEFTLVALLLSASATFLGGLADNAHNQAINRADYLSKNFYSRRELLKKSIDTIEETNKEDKKIMYSADEVKSLLKGEETSPIAPSSPRLSRKFDLNSLTFSVLHSHGNLAEVSGGNINDYISDDPDAEGSGEMYLRCTSIAYGCVSFPISVMANLANLASTFLLSLAQATIFPPKTQRIFQIVALISSSTASILGTLSIFAFMMAITRNQKIYKQNKLLDNNTDAILENLKQQTQKYKDHTKQTLKETKVLAQSSE